MSFQSDRFDSAKRACQYNFRIGNSKQTIIDETRLILADLGMFGKELDRVTRRIVRQVTGISLCLGEGHGTKLDNGTISYRG